MNKTELLDKFSRNGEERTLLARVLDRSEECERKGYLTVTAFLSPEEQEKVKNLLSCAGKGNAVLYGGYEYAERKMCLFLPDWMEEFAPDEECPIACVRAAFRADMDLSHRDFLGSLMGIGLTREKIGDIILSEGSCDVLICREVLRIILTQWESAGRVPLTVEEVPLSEVRFAAPKVKEVRDTLASLRLDSAVASAFSTSRSKAAEYIAAGRVALNHAECLKPDRAIAEGDILTCRGLGKAKVKEVGGVSKKGRTIVTFERYV